MIKWDNYINYGDTIVSQASRFALFIGHGSHGESLDGVRHPMQMTIRI